MAFTTVAFAYGSVLTSTKMTQMYDNFIALAPLAASGTFGTLLRKTVLSASDATWAKLSTTQVFFVECYSGGCGGGGGGAGSSGGQPGGAGGAGGSVAGVWYAAGHFATGSVSNPIAVTVGAGGAGGAGGTGNGGAGGTGGAPTTSSFGSLVVTGSSAAGDVFIGSQDASGAGGAGGVGAYVSGSNGVSTGGASGGASGWGTGAGGTGVAAYGIGGCGGGGGGEGGVNGDGVAGTAGKTGKVIIWEFA